MIAALGENRARGPAGYRLAILCAAKMSSASEVREPPAYRGCTHRWLGGSA